MVINGKKLVLKEAVISMGEIDNDVLSLTEAEISDQFALFLLEDENVVLTESEILDEGKVKEAFKRLGAKIKKGANWVRWKMAKFSVCFLAEKSLNDFFTAYYADKDGKPTEKGKEYCNKTKKEKVRRLRDLMEALDQSDKDKIINSSAAKQLEKSGLINLGGAAISGVTAGVAGASQGVFKGQSASNANQAAEIRSQSNSLTVDTIDHTTQTLKFNDKGELILPSGVNPGRNMDDYINNSNVISGTGPIYNKNLLNKLDKLAGLFSVLASVAFGVMWVLLLLLLQEQLLVLLDYIKLMLLEEMKLHY